MKKNVFNLKHFTDMYKPHIIFISEPQIFQADLPQISKYFRGEYSLSLNSEDLHNPDLVLTTSKAKGGTMVMWLKELDPYLTVHIAESSSFLPIVLDIPGWKTMIHIATYLPTSGQDSEYHDALASLKVCTEELAAKFPSSALFIRGDCNSSKTNPKRNAVFSNFCNELQLLRVELQHNTYHHFLGQGSFDSELDVLLFSGKQGVSEELSAIHCVLHDHRVDSHHDLLISNAIVPTNLKAPADTSRNVTAPKVHNTRHKIVWDESSKEEYELLLSMHLPRIRNLWMDSSSPSSMSILFEATSMILSQAALLLNKSIDLSSSVSTKSANIPPAIQRSNRCLARAAKKLRMQSNNPLFSPKVVEDTRTKYKAMKSKHQRLIRRRRMNENCKRDSKTFSVFSSNTSSLFKAVRSSKSSSNIAVKKLTVRDRIYEAESVNDGFYDSISHLKSQVHAELISSLQFEAENTNYENILRVCKAGEKVPRISIEKTNEILTSIRPSVADYASITGYHFRNGGPTAITHLQEVLNAVLDNLAIMDIEPLNTAWACILFKGHGKDRTSSESYRTISSCPFYSWLLDSYIDKIYG